MNDLWSRQLTIEEFVTKFFNIQCYVPYLKDANEKVYEFISFLPLTYKDKIEFDMPKSMDEENRKDKLYYILFKERFELSRTYQRKKN